jgi:hypothetical protein
VDSPCNHSAKQIAQFDKLKGTIEEYADREAEEVKSRYVAKLALEREATLRLKGENGIMKKKFSTLNKQASHTLQISGVSPTVPGRRVSIVYCWH